MARVSFSPAAVREARRARDAWREREPRTVEGFRSRLGEARRLLSEFPESGSEHLYGTRRLDLQPYPYYLVYRIAGSDVRVLAVPHARQQPDYWRERP